MFPSSSSSSSSFDSKASDSALRRNQEFFLWNSCHHIMTPLSHCHLLLVVAALAVQVSSSCYYPDGTYIAADRPCITNGTQGSFCCGQEGVTCLSDKVCYNSNTTSGNEYVRGSCTDQSFRSSTCPSFCLSTPFPDVCGGLYNWPDLFWRRLAPSDKAGVMFQCGFLTDSYCCSPDGSPCSCENDNVTLAAASSDVYSIAYIPSSISATASEISVLPPSTTDSSTLFK